MKFLSANYRGVRLDMKNIYHADEWHQVLVPAQGKLNKTTSPSRKSGAHISEGRETRPATRLASHRLFHNFLTSLYSNTFFLLVLNAKNEFLVKKILANYVTIKLNPQIR
jgi:hypothetical protein